VTPDEYREAHGMDDDTEEDAVSEWTHDALAAVDADGLVNSAACAWQPCDTVDCCEFGAVNCPQRALAGDLT
jgi:hypothetical protein